MRFHCWKLRNPLYTEEGPKVWDRSLFCSCVNSRVMKTKNKNTTSCLVDPLNVSFLFQIRLASHDYCSVKWLEREPLPRPHKACFVLVINSCKLRRNNTRCKWDFQKANAITLSDTVTTPYVFSKQSLSGFCAKLLLCLLNSVFIFSCFFNWNNCIHCLKTNSNNHEQTLNMKSLNVENTSGFFCLAFRKLTTERPSSFTV